MSKLLMCLILSVCLLAGGFVHAQEIKEYTVKRAGSAINIDGSLDEQVWNEAALTEHFVIYTDSTAPRFPTQAQIVWDDNYLYIAFTMDDEDVWAEMVNHDDHLWEEEVAEVYIDADDDLLNYLEIEINPLGTVVDLTLDKGLCDGGTTNFEWNLEGLLIGIGVDGTLNDNSDTDTKWICELAFPFENLAFSAPTKDFPPTPGDSWRLNLYRYDYDRTGEWHNELSAWNKTENCGFHDPEHFGRLIFSDEIIGEQDVDEQDASSYLAFAIKQNYPNPFNSSTTIEFSLTERGLTSIDVYNVTGQKVRSLFSGIMPAGVHSVVWNGRDDKGIHVTSGIYFSRMGMGSKVAVHRMLFLK